MSEYVVTALETQKTNKKKYNLYLDGEFYCGLTQESVAIFRIKVGQILTDEKLKDILNTTETQIAFDKSLNYISRGMKTKRQVKEYLDGKHFSEIVVKNVLDKLENYGYVDDGDYANVYVAQNKKNKGTFRLKQEMLMKGISKETVEEVLVDVDDEESFENAFFLAQKLVKDKPLEQKLMAKVNRYLLSRGFSYEIVGRVICKLKEISIDA